MKCLLYLLYLMAMVSCCETSDVGAQDDFIHATYTVAGRMKDPSYIKSQNYEEFQFTYIFAQPNWEVNDFDKTQEEINNKYVHNWSYADFEGHAYVEELIQNIHQNGDNKILCSFQGEKFIDITTDAARRKKFANMMAAFVKKHNYDGIELDWEHTVSLPEHALFIKDIRESLNDLQLDKQLYLCTALHTYQTYSQELADELSKHVDWINIMTYDMGGGIWGNMASHNTPLNGMRAILKNWEVFSPKKLCIGLASYGFYYKGISPNEVIPEGMVLEDFGRYFSYTELPDLLENGWVEKWDDRGQAPYYFSSDGTEFVTMDSERSLALKMDWVYEQGYRGVFWWEFHTDWVAPQSQEARGTHFLMDGVTAIINNNQ